MYRIEPLCRPRRIAVISAHTSPLGQLGGYKTGGLNVYVRETAVELARLGYQIDIFTRDEGSMPEVVPFAPGVRTIHLAAGPHRATVDTPALWEHLPTFLNSLRAFKERERLRYDLVFSHYWMSGWAGGYLARLWDVPHVTMFHTLGEAKNRARPGEHEPPHRIATERRVIATADAVIAATDHEADLLVDLYGADAQRIEIVPCGVNTGLFQARDRAACRRELGLGGGPVVLFVGRLEPLKGPDLLIEALPLLPSDTVLVIAGGSGLTPDYVRGLEQRAAALGVAERVHFPGPVPQERLAAYYGAADVCAVPSYYESFGLVALESMACGTPVVATRAGGLTSTVRDGVNGYLIPWRSPEAFAERIGVLLADPALRAGMSDAARGTARRFRWSEVGADLDRLFARLCRAHRQARLGCHVGGGSLVMGGAAGAHERCHARESR